METRPSNKNETLCREFLGEGVKKEEKSWEKRSTAFFRAASLQPKTNYLLIERANERVDKSQNYKNAKAPDHNVRSPDR